MPLPDQDQRFQQIGATQEGTVEQRLSPDNHVIAAPSTGMAPVDHELVRPQPRLAGLLVDRLGGGDVKSR